MFEEVVATPNGHVESGVFAPAEGAPETALWPIREDVWAPHQPSVANETGEEMFEDMPTETMTQEFGAFEETATEYPAEYPGEQFTQEDSVFEDSVFEAPIYEDPVFEARADEGAASEDGSSASIHTANEDALEDTSEEETAFEETWAGETDEGSPFAESATESGRDETGYEQTGYEQTGYEQTGYEQTGYEQTGYEQTGYEQTGYEQTGYEQTGYEDTAFEYVGSESIAPETYEYTSQTHEEVNPELLDWPSEILEEDWSASGKASASADSRFGIAEHLYSEDQLVGVAAGERTVANLPLLRSHRGAQPDLVVRWNAMPHSTSTVDVVVHLHGYSASGPRMKIADKAAASGVALGPSSAGARITRPMIGLIPRGNYFGGQSGAGYNFPQLVQPGAINQLVAIGLDLLRAQTGVRARMGRLILTAHSGGGSPLNAILRHTDADEVHLFDGSYGEMTHLIAWARRRLARGSSDSALRVLFRLNSGTARHALAIAAAICPTITAAPNAAALHQRFRVEATSVEHNLIPRTYGPTLLADAGADLPGAVRRGCIHSGSRPASAPTAPPVRPSPSVAAPSGAVLTRTPDRLAGIVRVTPYAKDGTHALPGAKALAGQWRRLTGRQAGTFNARNTSFGTRSLHSEGRAIDCHGHVSRPTEAAQAEAYIRWLVANAVELQVATIIWNRRIWSWKRRAEGWRSYMTKPNHNPHTDHFHVDLSWEGAQHPSPLFAGSVPGLAVGATPAPTRSLPPAPSRPVGPPAPPPAGAGTQPGVRRSPAEFVRLFGPFAKASQARTGVPGLVTLAQAAVESGWGARAAGNNFFGIKARASDASGTRQLWRTREVLSRPDVRTFPEVISVTRRPDGRYNYVVRDWFRVFPSPELAFVGHGEFLRRNKRYAPAFAFGHDPYRFAAEVARAGYATDPNYTKVVHSVMRLLERNGWS